MLLELRVRDLGVIDELSLTLADGMWAVTGETGAGKTLIVEAVNLLLGGRADPRLVRPTAAEAIVEGRFTRGADDADEVVLRRVVPATGRSRCYIDGGLATTAELTALGAELVEIHGQHAHHRLARPGAQRAALDEFGAVDDAALRAVRAEVRQLEERLAGFGGDDRGRARELDLLRFQIDEIEAARLQDEDEEARLEAEESLLADAVAHRESGAVALAALRDDDGALGRIGDALAALRDRAPFAGVVARLRAGLDDLDDVASELRATAETIEPDPQRLAEVRARRQAIRDLCRKYGTDVTAVLAELEVLRARARELHDWDDRARRTEADLEVARRTESVEAERVAGMRRAAAAPLAAAVTARLGALGLPNARFEVAVEGSDGAHVVYLFTANKGSPPQELGRVASGGELARCMLALRLALREDGAARSGEGPAPTQIFDEVDAGIGGAAATAVGRALAGLARGGGQVLVVTHLAQVAAWAHGHVSVTKLHAEDQTVSSASVLDPDTRVVELARMLSGTPDSERARAHAAELLAAAAD